MSQPSLGADGRALTRQQSAPIVTPTGAAAAPFPRIAPPPDDQGDVGSPALTGSISGGSGRGPMFLAGRPGTPSSGFFARATPPPSGAELPTSASAFMAALKASAAPKPPVGTAPAVPVASPVTQAPPIATMTATPPPSVPPLNVTYLSSSQSQVSGGAAAMIPSAVDDDEEEETEKKPAAPPQPGMTILDKRKLVLLEIVNTERDYLNDLDLILEIFQKPIVDRNLLKPMETATIFSNVQELIGINKEFLRLLEASRADVGADMPAMRVAEDFARMVEPFKRYARYFADQAFALSTLEKCQGEPAFKAFVAECMMNPKARGLSFFAFLIKPVQRICKYPLLLRELIKSTPENHLDYGSLLEAAKEVEALVAMLNEKKRATETHQKVLELMTSVEGLDQQPTFVKGSSSRYFINEAELKVGSGKKGIKMRVYLFNDVILYHSVKEKHKGEKKYDFGGIAAINQFARLVDVADGDDDKHSFQIRHADGNITFVCASADEKKKWTKEIKARIADTIKKGLKSDERSATPQRNGSPRTQDRLTSSSPTLGAQGSVVDMLFSSNSSPAPKPAPATSGPNGQSLTWSGTSSPKGQGLEKVPSSDTPPYYGTPPTKTSIPGSPKPEPRPENIRGESWMDAMSHTSNSPVASSPLASPTAAGSFSPVSYGRTGSPALINPLPTSPSAEQKPSSPLQMSGSSLPAAFYTNSKPLPRGLSQPNFRAATPDRMSGQLTYSSPSPVPPSAVGAPSFIVGGGSAATGAPSFIVGGSGSSPPTPPTAGQTSITPPEPASPVSREGSGPGYYPYNTPTPMPTTPTPTPTPTPMPLASRGQLATPTGASGGERQTAAGLMAALGLTGGVKQSRLRGSLDPESVAALGPAPVPSPSLAPSTSTAGEKSSLTTSGTHYSSFTSGGTSSPTHTSHGLAFPTSAPPPEPTSVPTASPAVAIFTPAPTLSVSSPPTPPTAVVTPSTPVYNPAYPAPASAAVPAAAKAGVAKQLVTVVKQPVQPPVGKQQVGVPSSPVLKRPA